MQKEPNLYEKFKGFFAEETKERTDITPDNFKSLFSEIASRYNYGGGLPPDSHAPFLKQLKEDLGIGAEKEKERKKKETEKPLFTENKKKGMIRDSAARTGWMEKYYGNK